tara:strand:- start:67 stop:1116 length:1050 start_codon:yes stop_codon:yes gene_type:complete
MKRILLTGGAGYIGSHTCLVLLEMGYELIVLDSYINSSPEAINRVLDLIKIKNPDYSKKLHLIKGDIRDSKILREIFLETHKEGKEIEGVIHFAGLKAVGESVKNPLKYWDANVYGTINLLQVMDSFDCRTFIFSSSATIYGISNKFLTEENEIRPINPYGTTKATIEMLLNDVFNSAPEKWKIANLRYFNPIGAHDSGRLGEEPLGIPNNIFPIITKVASGYIKVFQVYGRDWDTPDGTGVRDYIHVMDLAEGHVSALEHLLKSHSKVLNLNLGTGKGTSVLELINTFQEVNNVKVPYIFSDRRIGDTSTLIANNTFATSILNWSPKRTLSDMCKDGWAWQLFINSVQ